MDPSNEAAGSAQDPGDAPGAPERSLWERFSHGLREFYVAPYRRTFARARREEEDLFMVMVLAEALGVPNPVSYYTIELMPVIYERFHDWHKRQGMDSSPLDYLACC